MDSREQAAYDWKYLSMGSGAACWWSWGGGRVINIINRIPISTPLIRSRSIRGPEEAAAPDNKRSTFEIYGGGASVGPPFIEFQYLTYSIHTLSVCLPPLPPRSPPFPPLDATAALPCIFRSPRIHSLFGRDAAQQSKLSIALLSMEARSRRCVVFCCITKGTAIDLAASYNKFGILCICLI